MKKFADEFQIRWKWLKGVEKSRDAVGKRRNCSLRVISPFPTEFSKDFYCRHGKTRACLGKGSLESHGVFLQIDNSDCQMIHC